MMHYLWLLHWLKGKSSLTLLAPSAIKLGSPLAMHYSVANMQGQFGDIRTVYSTGVTRPQCKK
uniref:Uncharacterized protein n=1 Tax=Cannabis sativa TaxID=3483 RepID=A0A803NJ11_CANSA